MEEYTCCRYCEKSVFIPVTRNCICKLSGMVKQDFVCPQFVFDPFKIKIERRRGIDFSKYEEEDYSIE